MLTFDRQPVPVNVPVPLPEILELTFAINSGLCTFLEMT
jgi:hypothetical protein